MNAGGALNFHGRMLLQSFFIGCAVKGNGERLR
jgi:hypothetical protein